MRDAEKLQRNNFVELIALYKKGYIKIFPIFQFEGDFQHSKL